MLTKKIFCDTIRFMEERETTIREINKMFTKEFDDSSFFPYSKWESQTVKILADVMCDKNNWISYYWWKFDLGSKQEVGTITIADRDIPLSTPEQLCELLVSDTEIISVNLVEKCKVV